MAEPIDYTVPMGANIEAACTNLANLAWRENRPARMTFNGTEVVCQPGDTSGDVLDRLAANHHEQSKEVVATITIDVHRGRSFTVRLGDAYHDELCWDEMLGCLCRLTMDGDPKPEKAGYGGLRTKEQWDAGRDGMKRHCQQSVAEVANGNG